MPRVKFVVCHVSI